MPKYSSTTALGPDRASLNGALIGARNKTMLSLIGNPRGTYDDQCRWPTNKRVLDLVVQRDVGPFKVAGLRPAVETLEQILVDIRQHEPEIYAVLGTAGMLCCRRVRGSATAISNHAWGTAIDLTVEGVLDKRGDGRAQIGLQAIAKYFNAHSFFWGAAFPTEDSMHFEASDQLIRQWHGEGRFGDARPQVTQEIFELGDRSEAVRTLQQRLNLVLGLDLDTDGIFGPSTRAAVMEFQRTRGTPITGALLPADVEALAA